MAFRNSEIGRGRSGKAQQGVFFSFLLTARDQGNEEELFGVRVQAIHPSFHPSIPSIGFFSTAKSTHCHDD